MSRRRSLSATAARPTLEIVYEGRPRCVDGRHHALIGPALLAPTHGAHPTVGNDIECEVCTMRYPALWTLPAAIQGGASTSVAPTNSATNVSASATPTKIEPSATGSPYPKPTSTAYQSSWYPTPTLTPRLGPLPTDDPGPGLHYYVPDFVVTSIWGLACDGVAYNVNAGSIDNAGYLVSFSIEIVGASGGSDFKLPAPTGYGPLSITSANCQDVSFSTTSGMTLDWVPGTRTWQ